MSASSAPSAPKLATPSPRTQPAHLRCQQQVQGPVHLVLQGDAIPLVVPWHMQGPSLGTRHLQPQLWLDTLQRWAGAALVQHLANQGRQESPQAGWVLLSRLQ